MVKSYQVKFIRFLILKLEIDLFFFPSSYRRPSIFQESNGTTLSTDWSEVSKKKLETNPPDVSDDSLLPLRFFL